MADDHIKLALEETVRQMTALINRENTLQVQQWEIHKERFKLIAKMHSLAALCDDLPQDSFVGRFSRDIEHTGLTAATRNILKGVGEWMSVSQLRDQLIRFRIDLGRYKNPNSSIHTILTRFVKSGEIEQKIDPKTQKPLFRAKPPVSGYMYSEETIESTALSLLESKKRRRSKNRTKTEGVKLLEGKKEGSLKAS